MKKWTLTPFFPCEKMDSDPVFPDPVFSNVTTGIEAARTDRFLRHMGFRQTGGNYVLEGVAESGAPRHGERKVLTMEETDR